ncbi:type I polyketide synthase, partial [Catenulispora rubra]|uniref:acyltransferase domain-containing protein n=1 Tax=Catenulispora rubra TaxID=280293 RepID=UPI001891F811
GGVIKAVMAMRAGVLPRTLHVDAPSPHVDWAGSGVSLLTEARSWPETGRPRRAAVSSFGISGTNAHVILEQPPETPVAEPVAGVVPPTGSELGHAETSESGPDSGSGVSVGAGVVPWMLSARTPEALNAQAARLLETLSTAESAISDLAASDPATCDPTATSDLAGSGVAASDSVTVGGDEGLVAATPGDPAGVARALLRTRSVFAHRAAVLGQDHKVLLDGLRVLAQGASAPEVIRHHAPVVQSGRTAFLFTGQGSQRLGMGLGLYAAFPVYAETFDEVCEHLDPHLEQPLRNVLSDQAALIDQTGYAQPALFALQTALYRLLESAGLTPDLLLGHSLGELTSAHLAGVLSLQDACRLVAARGRLMQGAEPGGAMVSIRADAADVQGSLIGHEDRVSIAAVNGPQSTVISGDPDAVNEIATGWRVNGVRTKRLRTSHAFHSPHMDAVLSEFHAVAAAISYAPARIPIVSSRTGLLATDEELGSPRYWTDQIRDTVDFRGAMRTLEQAGATRYIECGPDAVLCAMAVDNLETAPEYVLPTLRADRPEAQILTQTLAHAWTTGTDIAWTTLLPPTPSTGQAPDLLPDLPTYPFQHTRYWLAPAAGGSAEALGQDSGGHPLLDAVVAHPDGGITGTAVLTVDRCAWIRDHAVYGTVVLPGAALLELVLHIAAGAGHPHLQELTLQAPLVLSEDDRLHLNVTYRPDPDPGTGSGTVTIHTRPAEADEPPAWTHHATAVLTAEPAPAPDPVPAPRSDTTAIAPAVLYADLHDRGYDYGPTFQGLTDIRHHGHQAWATATLPEPAA